MNEDVEFSLPSNYEWLRQRIENLPTAAGEVREVEWLEPQRVLGVARDKRGRVEVFITGGALQAIDPAVQSALEHGKWSSRSSDVIFANRFRLPDAPHFDEVSAFICAELLRKGVSRDQATAFGTTEPVIALAYRRAREGDPFIVGLAGELLLLRMLLARAVHGRRDEVFATWKGFDRTTRDFQVGTVGVEVKTTAGNSSEHQVSGLAQIELGISVGGEPETDLFLMSFGIKWLDLGETHGQSLGGLIDHIRGLLPSNASREAFGAKLSAYGSGSSDAVPLEASQHYKRPFTTTFERLYDMSDSRILLPKQSDLAAFSHLIGDSLNFRVALPNQVNGDLNPIDGLVSSADEVLRRAGLLA